MMDSWSVIEHNWRRGGEQNKLRLNLLKTPKLLNFENRSCWNSGFRVINQG